MLYFNVVTAKYIENYKLFVKFADNKEGVIDLEEYIVSGEIFKPLINKNLFKSFVIEYGTICWQNGEIDIAPETLYESVTKTSVTYNLNDIYKKTA